EIMINPSAVGDENGEYFELWNPGTTGVDINGYTITDNGSDSHVISTDTPLMVPGGGFVVLGRDADVSTNGGVTVHYQYSNFSLGNNGDEVIVINQTGTEIDRVEYTPGGFPIADGAAMELKLGLIDPSTQNDIGDSWQTSVVALSGGDFGTPGAANQMTMPSPGTIVGRFAFYNDSRFDNNSPAIDQNDDTAIDPTKRPLMPGQTAGPDNYVNYHRGLNGIMIDIDNLPDSQATLDDFVFSIGNDNQPNSWAVLDAVANLVVRPGAGIDGSDRVVITFPDGTIDNQWLEVTVLSSGPNRIVANDDEHYWGSAPGDTSDAGTDISVVDASRVAANFSGFFDPPITIDVPLDVNKDATVSVADRSFIVSRFTGFFDEPLQLISIPDPSDQFDIEIFFPDDTLTASQRSAFSVAANRWEEIIIGDLPDVGEIDDVRITATAPLIDGIGNILGQAGPDSVRSGSFLPLTGSMEFDAADIAALEDADRLEAVILHEMGHVLGLGTIWDLLDLLDTSDPEDPRFIGDAAVEEYNVLFNVDGNSVPVENNGGEGTALGHWEQDDNRDSSVASFGDELMTGFLTGELNPISRVTVAQFQDLGYVVNLDAADEFQPINNVAKDTHAKGRILAVPFGGLESALADAVWSRWP
ncbi:MAG: lamin tail domain-containing protein, partial [Planctomycetota bacterium]